jgi:hypothetical protein
VTWPYEFPFIAVERQQANSFTLQTQVLESLGPLLRILCIREPMIKKVQTFDFATLRFSPERPRSTAPRDLLCSGLTEFAAAVEHEPEFRIL